MAFLTSRTNPIDLSGALQNWVFTDSEPDDLVGVLLDPEKVIIAEPHKKIADTFQRMKDLLACLPSKEAQVMNGKEESTYERLCEILSKLPEKSLRIQLIAPSPTLNKILKEKGELLAKKVDRIVAFGGFTYRERMKDDGTVVEEDKFYYTTFNLSQNIAASQQLFDFAQKNQVPLYLLGSDTLRLDLRLNTWLPQEVVNCQTPATEYIKPIIPIWNKAWSSSSQAKEKVERVSQVTNKTFEEVQALSMTPGDTIAIAFDNQFDALNIISDGIEDVKITDDPRYEKKGDSVEKSSHRRVVFTTDVPSSSIRLVKSFTLEKLDKTETYKKIVTELLEKHKH